MKKVYILEDFSGEKAGACVANNINEARYKFRTFYELTSGSMNENFSVYSLPLVEVKMEKEEKC